MKDMLSEMAAKPWLQIYCKCTCPDVLWHFAILAEQQSSIGCNDMQAPSFLCHAEVSM